MCCPDDVGMARQSQIVVGAEVQDFLAACHAHMPRLRGGNDTLGLFEACGPDRLQRLREMRAILAVHQRSAHFRTTLPELPVRMAAKPFSNSV